jgi:hypothetical protein
MKAGYSLCSRDTTSYEVFRDRSQIGILYCSNISAHSIRSMAEEIFNEREICQK